MVGKEYLPSIYGVGYIGKGKYKSSIKKKRTRCYSIWANMLQRCYDPYYINKRLTYKDVFVCEEWLCFQNFAEWYYKNVYNCNNERMCLDKDILVKGNKLYSPETCILVPERINMLFVKCDNIRGQYPIGVHYNKKDNRLQVRCRIYKNNKSERIYLGQFPLNRPFQAFTCYKNFKENYIKQVADEYKDLIPAKLYDALYKWEVEIND